MADTRLQDPAAVQDAEVAVPLLMMPAYTSVSLALSAPDNRSVLRALPRGPGNPHLPAHPRGTGAEPLRQPAGPHRSQAFGSRRECRWSQVPREVVTSVGREGDCSMVDWQTAVWSACEVPSRRPQRDCMSELQQRWSTSVVNTSQPNNSC